MTATSQSPSGRPRSRLQNALLTEERTSFDGQWAKHKDREPKNAGRPADKMCHPADVPVSGFD